MKDETGRQRVIIEGVEPEIDCGRFPIKRTVGEGFRFLRLMRELR